MKKVKRLLGLVISLVMLASTIPANAAETSTKVFFDDFESEASMSEYVIDESNSPYAVWLNDGKLKINQRRGAKKTFDTPYTGMVAVEYDAGMNELVNNVMDIGLTAADGKACVFRLILKDYLYVRGEDGTQWSTLSWYAPDVITKNLSDTFNHVKVVFDFGKQEIYVTVSNNEYGTKTEMVGKFPVEMKAVTYIKMMDNKDLTGGWQNHTYFDNVAVWQRDIPTMPEYTYLKNDFTNLSGDYFGGDLYSTVKYAVDSNQGSRYPTDASATDPIATSLIKFENGAMEVGNGYTDPTTQETSNYCAVIELPEQINNEMVELSFKARMKDPTAQGKFGKVALFAKGVAYGISIHWEGGKSDEVRFNHQYGQANNNGFKLAMFVDYANRNYQLTAEGSAKYGNTLNLSTVGPKIDMVGAEKYAEAKVALPKANGKAPAAPSVSMPEKVKDAVILRMQSANAWANGKISKIDSANSAVMPKIVDGRTLVPARFISESFGGEVGWNADTRTVTIKINGKTVELTIDNKDLIIDGAKAAEMDVPAQIIESRTMVPLRVLCETVLGKKVFWDPMGLIVISNEGILDASADADIIKTTFDLLK